MIPTICINISTAMNVNIGITYRYGAGCTPFVSFVTSYRIVIPYMVSFDVYFSFFSVHAFYLISFLFMDYLFFPHVLFRLSIEFRFAPYASLPNRKCLGERGKKHAVEESAAIRIGFGEKRVRITLVLFIET